MRADRAPMAARPAASPATPRRTPVAAGPLASRATSPSYFWPSAPGSGSPSSSAPPTWASRSASGRSPSRSSWSCSLLERDLAALEREHHGVEPRAGVQLRDGIAHMGAHRLGGNLQLARHLLAGVTAREQG